MTAQHASLTSPLVPASSCQHGAAWGTEGSRHARSSGFEPLNGGVGTLEATPVRLHAARWKSALDLCAFSAGSTAYTSLQLPKGYLATT